MQSVTTKAIAKVAAVATGLAMATSMLSLAPMAHAASLTDAQVQSILSLLTSFGADSATIANVQAALTGQPSTSGSTSGSTGAASSCNFTMDLHDGSSGAEVTCLQKALIAGGYDIPAITSGTANYGYFGSQTKTAVIAWQKAAGVSPTSGYFGPISRSHWNLGGGSSTSGSGSTSGSTSGNAGTGNGLKVSLSATSPNGTVLIKGQAIGDLGEFTFANPTASPINVTSLTFNRIGASNDETLTNIYLYSGSMRLTDSVGISNSQFVFNNAGGLFTVPAGGTYTVSVRSDILSSATVPGQVVGVQLVSVASSGTLDSSVSLPISSGYQSIASASLAAVSYGSTVSPAAGTISAQNDYPIWQNTVSVSTNPVKLTSMRFTNLGSADSSSITNLRLYVDGVQVGSAIPTMGADRSVTFDLSASPVTLSTSSHTIKLLANITNSAASRTVLMSVQRASDAMFIDSQLGQPVTPTSNGNTFSAESSGSITIQSASAGVSVSTSPSSPTNNVAAGATDVKFASFDMLASGENVKVQDLYVFATTTGGNGLNNGKIMVNGVQVGSTKDIGEGASNATDFSLGSSLILPAGQTTTVDVYADAKNTSGTDLANGDTVIVSLKSTSNNGQGQSSLQTTNVPAANTHGNTITVSSSSLTATKYTGFGDQTVVPGANSAQIGSFTLSTGSTEGVTVNTIGVDFSSSPSSKITNLTLKDHATGNVIGTVITTPSATNSFAVNFDIPSSSTKTVDVYANVLSSATGSLTPGVDATTGGIGDSTGSSAYVGGTSPTSGYANSTKLQTITLGSGQLHVNTGAGDPVSDNILAGASQVKVGQFQFSAVNSQYTVKNLSILVPNNEATAVTNVTLSFKDANGATQTVSQPLQVNTSLPYATATFSGLTMNVPSNDSSNVDVYVGTPTIASAGTNISGTGINVKLATGKTSSIFEATNAAGTATTTINNGNTVSAGGTFYVRKSIPTLATVSTGVTVPSTGSPLYKFSITADPAGAIDWSQIAFNIATSASTGSTDVYDMYLTDDSSGTQISDGTVDGNGSGKATFSLFSNSTYAKYQQVAAGATKTYDLYGTVSGYTTGSTVTISLASDSTASSTTNTAAAMGASNNFVWSDRSATDHASKTVTATDWTNGYLVKNFTSSAISYSK